MVLASSREGMANVLIESLACGCPVVATSSWGTPEVIRDRAAGVLVADRSSAALAAGVAELFDSYPDRQSTLEYAQGFDWSPTTKGQMEIFRSIKRPES
jgi:glycosyltransferase involved in cell wall biosynthesis